MHIPRPETQNRNSMSRMARIEERVPGTLCSCSCKKSQHVPPETGIPPEFRPELPTKPQSLVFGSRINHSMEGRFRLAARSPLAGAASAEKPAAKASSHGQHGAAGCWVALGHNFFLFQKWCYVVLTLELLEKAM